VLFVIDISIEELHLMTQKKRSRGRPIGGKQPEVIRQYWRTMQQVSRQMRKQIGEKNQ
jgi:hypothetical protein